MPDITEQDKDVVSSQISKVRQWMWFIGLYFAGLLVTAAVVYFFRGLIGLAT